MKGREKEVEDRRGVGEEATPECSEASVLVRAVLNYSLLPRLASPHLAVPLTAENKKTEKAF